MAEKINTDWLNFSRCTNGDEAALSIFPEDSNGNDFLAFHLTPDTWARERYLNPAFFWSLVPVLF